jgi:hypothetical protein
MLQILLIKLCTFQKILIPNVLTIWERCAIVTIKVHPDIVTKELRETEQNIIQDM